MYTNLNMTSYPGIYKQIKHPPHPTPNRNPPLSLHVVQAHTNSHHPPPPKKKTRTRTETGQDKTFTNTIKMMRPEATHAQRGLPHISLQSHSQIQIWYMYKHSRLSHTSSHTKYICHSLY